MRIAKTFRIADRAALASLLQGALLERFDDNMASACASLYAENVRWALKRVLEKKVGRLNDTLLRHLRCLICTDEATEDAFYGALIPPSVRLDLHRYRWWRDTGGHPWATGARGGDGGLSPERLWVSVVSPRERTERLTALEEDLQKDPDAQRIWRQFVNRAKKLGHGDERIALAWRRAIDPLVAHADTGGIERGWHELRPRERRLYFTHATEAELILLKRASDLTRALAAHVRR